MFFDIRNHGKYFSGNFYCDCNFHNCLRFFMILVVPGQDAVTSVLSYDDKFRHLLPFLNGDEDFESKMKKSVSSRYAAVLLNLMFLHSNKMEFCERFSTQLQAIPKKGR